ncbi:ATP-binding protein [Mycolicibacterium fortuitum]|uniref:ATP-binding protein n=1 Tax=Mycolicibacterium fortuitum TaxID=1766 RepID=UPI000AA3BA6D|nr:ATP-binding protein [Mycolicibacterium fortuitum]
MSSAESSRFRLTDQRVLAKVGELQKEFPVAAVHRRAFQLLGSDFSYASRNSDGTWLVLVHFGQSMQGAFGFTRDIALVYMSHMDLQTRDFKRLPQRLHGIKGDREAEDHLFLVASKDVRAVRKLDKWSEDAEFTAVALPSGGDERTVAEAIRESIQMRLATRNLYDERDPVTGKDFFGRKQLLAQLVEELRQGNVCGIFGLRKTGKTSVITELGKRFTGENSDKRIFILLDLESLPSDSGLVAGRFVKIVRDLFLDELRLRRLRTHELQGIGDNADLGQLQRALQTSLRNCRENSTQVVLALDEVESLVGDADDIRRGARTFVPEVLGVIRALVQQNENFSVIFSGITSALIEKGYLYGRENPLFSWAKSYYIPPMSKPEITDLTKEVGRRMYLNWSTAALDRMYEVSEGNVYVQRTLAAQIAGSLDDGGDRNIGVEHVNRGFRVWTRESSQIMTEMLASARRHYPDELEMLELFFGDRATFDYFASSVPSDLSRLIDLTLIDEDPEGALRPGALARLLRGVKAL